jgi:hypothetical protein
MYLIHFNCKVGSTATFSWRISQRIWSILVFSGTTLDEIFSIQHLLIAFLSRYLNNPEVMSGASFLGLALISGSKLVGVLAIIRFLSFWWFLQTVEK